MAGTVIACHTTDEFDAQLAKAKQAGKPVVIDFTDPMCSPCKAMAPVFAACAKEYPTQAVFLSVEVRELEEVASDYCIQGTPTFVFIGDDGFPWESFAGAFPDKLRNTVKEFIENNPAAAASAVWSA